MTPPVRRIDRRGFLGALAACAVAPFVPTPTPKPALAFHRDAFALTMQPYRGTFTRGDVITIENRYVMNPVTRRATPYLQQFVVTGYDVTTETVAVCPRPAGLDHRCVPLELTTPVCVGTVLWDSAWEDNDRTVYTERRTRRSAPGSPHLTTRASTPSSSSVSSDPAGQLHP